MTIRVHHRESCRLCGSRDLELALSLPPTPPATAYGRPATGPGSEASAEPMEPCFPLDLYRCATCGHVQLLDVLDPFALFQRHRSATATIPPLADRARAFAAEIMARRPLRRDDLVVAVGSNDGTLLKPFEAAGCRVLGVEPAVDLAGAAVAGGIDTYPGFFQPAIAERLEDQHGRAAVVIADSVLAHADDLTGLLDAVGRLLAKDGLFVFEVPSLAAIVGDGLFDAIGHETLDYHAVAPLQRLLLACDLELIAVEPRADRGGSLRGWVRRLGGPPPEETTVAAAIERERAFGLDRIETIRNLGERITFTRQRLFELLDPLRAAVGGIAGYGACGRAVTFCHAVGLDAATLAFVADDSTWKHGLLTPGHGVPIVSPETLTEREPAAVVVLAWPFAGSIIAHNAGFQATGGRFVVALPEPRFVGPS